MLGDWVYYVYCTESLRLLFWTYLYCTGSLATALDLLCRAYYVLGIGSATSTVLYLLGRVFGTTLLCLLYWAHMSSVLGLLGLLYWDYIVYSTGSTVMGFL